MNDDIRPPQRQRPVEPAPLQSPPPAASPAPDIDIQMQSQTDLQPLRRRSRRRMITLIVAGVVAVFAILATGTYMWYQLQLKPVDSTNKRDTRVTITSGTGPSDIGVLLKQKDLIRSQAGFYWYLRLNGGSGKLQAGVYVLSKNMSLPTIVEHLTSGKVDTLSITFLPGATVAEDKTVLRKAGFKSDAIDAAFAKSYDNPLFATKPASADLEGYVYGETYDFSADVTVEQILMRTFDEMYGVIKQEHLVEAYKKQGLTLYQGITLASIVQREVNGESDQKVVAGIFLNRLKKDINLGSDVTYQYIADKTGQPRNPTLDSPYNTRKYKGLPPGPISSPGQSALIAVGSPTKSGYLFFLSGDDGKTYYGHTQAEHEANIKQHCQKKCQIL